jgi:hypothetical protein
MRKIAPEMRAAALLAGERGGENETRSDERVRLAVTIAERVDAVEREC